jgi:hypothetical protein
MKMLINLYEYHLLPDAKQYNAIYGEIVTNNKYIIKIGNEEEYIVVRKTDIKSFIVTDNINADTNVVVSAYDENNQEFNNILSPNQIFFFNIYSSNLSNLKQDLNIK